MQLEFTDDQDELRSGVRNVLERECPRTLARSFAEGSGDAGALWKHMVELGWPALTVPETAAALRVSPSTVDRQWACARAWLFREITEGNRL